VIRVALPYHLRTLAGLAGEVELPLDGAVTLRHVLDHLEAAYPPLRGALRDHSTGRRRPFIRFFACQQDLSHDPLDAVLPQPVCQGSEPLLIIGAIAGG
jgi:hypothetical protein